MSAAPRMTRVLDPSGAQVLPHIADERATTSAYLTFTLCNADLRTRSAPHRAEAARLTIHPDKEPTA